MCVLMLHSNFKTVTREAKKERNALMCKPKTGPLLISASRLFLIRLRASRTKKQGIIARKSNSNKERSVRCKEEAIAVGG